MAREKRWAGHSSRTDDRVELNLGIVPGGGFGKSKKYRDKKLELLDAYYENRQYDHLHPWDKPGVNNEYVPVRKRKPRISYSFARMLCQRVGSKIAGHSTFPTLVIEEDPETQQVIALVMKICKLESRLVEPIRRSLAAGSSFVRYFFVDGVCKIESYLSKYCYPVFTASGELDSIRVQYQFEDPQDIDAQGKPKCKWYKLELTRTVDIEYDNPEVQETAEPTFVVKEKVEHNLGWVQGVWFRTHEDKHSPDGYSLIEDVLDFIDEINYSLSQSSTAVSYNQDPQLTISGMDAEEVDELVKSSSKAWNIGRDGKAAFLESTLGGVERASELRDKAKQGIQDIARVVMLDPEKFTAQAQSGRAMEALHGPLVELVNELRPVYEDAIIELVLKILLTMLGYIQKGEDVGLVIPPGWKPSSLNVTAQWPPIFPMTMVDLKEKLGVAVQATSANILSRETALRWMAKDFSIEDIEAELAKIAAQPVINPFGGF